jgi:hypothetical protein
MLMDAEVRRDIGEAGHNYAHGWSADRQAERVLANYHSVLASSESGDLQA